MPSVLHLIETGGQGGAEGIFLELVTRLDINGLRNMAVVARDGWLSDQLREQRIEPIVLNPQGSLNLGYLRQLAALIRNNKVQLVIAHLYGATVYACITGFLMRVPIVGVLHGQSDVFAYERFAAAKRWLVAHGAAKMVFVSSALQADLQRRLRLPAQQCVVIENGIDMARYSAGTGAGLRSALGLPSSAMLVGAVGNLRRAKGYETLLSAAQCVCATDPDAHFIIAGDTGGGLFPELQRLQAELGLQGRVHFLGSRNDVPAILRDLDLFVLSSDTEGFSLALVEAMATGLATIATKSGGPEGIIDADATGILVPPRDPQALAEAIRRALNDQSLRRCLGSAAKAAVGFRFSSERMVAAYRKLAISLLK